MDLKLFLAASYLVIYAAVLVTRLMDGANRPRQNVFSKITPEVFYGQKAR